MGSIIIKGASFKGEVKFDNIPLYLTVKSEKIEGEIKILCSAESKAFFVFVAYNKQGQFQLELDNISSLSITATSSSNFDIETDQHTYQFRHQKFDSKQSLCFKSVNLPLPYINIEKITSQASYVSLSEKVTIFNARVYFNKGSQSSIYYLQKHKTIFSYNFIWNYSNELKKELILITGNKVPCEVIKTLNLSYEEIPKNPIIVPTDECNRFVIEIPEEDKDKLISNLESRLFTVFD